MLSPDCKRFSLGRPVISVGALLELRDVLATLRQASIYDEPSLERVSKEGVNEATSESNDSTAKSAAQRRTGAAVPGGKQRDLEVALMELLINAARESIEERENGGEHEPETDR